MSRLYIVVEKASDWGSFYPSDDVITAMEYLKQPIAAGEEERTQVINLCRSYKYLGVGYYVSLLAEARGHRVIPSVRTINDLRKRSLYGLDIEDLNQKLIKFLPQEGRDTTDFGLLVYFGTTNYAPLADLARQAFEIFSCPILRLEFERQKVWQIDAIKPAALHTLTDSQEDSFAQSLESFSKKLWRKPRSRKKFRYDIAMLCDPNEAMPPSNKKALRSFIEAGKDSTGPTLAGRGTAAWIARVIQDSSAKDLYGDTAEMPKFAGKLSPAEIEALAQYVAEQRPRE